MLLILVVNSSAAADTVVDFLSISSALVDIWVEVADSSVDALLRVEALSSLFRIMRVILLVINIAITKPIRTVRTEVIIWTLTAFCSCSLA